MAKSSIAQAKPITRPEPESEAKSKPERRPDSTAKSPAKPATVKRDHPPTPVHGRAASKSDSREQIRKSLPPDHRVSPPDKPPLSSGAERRNPFEPKHQVTSTKPGTVNLERDKPSSVRPPRFDMPALGSGARLPSIKGNNPRLTGPPGRWFAGPETRGGGDPGGRLASAPHGNANFAGSGNPRGSSGRSPGGGGVAGRPGAGAGGGGLGRGVANAGSGGASGGAQVLSRVMPNYPGVARSRKLQGWVMVEVTVGRNGSVSNPRVVGASPSGVFESAALEAILKWRFKPAMRQGVPIEQRVRQRVNFVLR